MGQADFLSLGTWNVACSMCGRKRKANQMMRNWKGFWRCPEHNEPREAQDFVRGVKDDISVPFTQKNVGIDIQLCTINGASAVPGWALPDCMTPDRSSPIALDDPY